MKKSLMYINALLVLLFTSLNLLADHDEAYNTKLKLAVEFSGNKLHISSIKLKASREKLKVLVVLLDEKKEKKEISDEDYEQKVEIIKAYEEECNEVEKDIIELDAVIKIKHSELKKANIEIKINTTEKEDEEHEHKQKNKHKKHKEWKEEDDEHHHKDDDHDDDDDDNNDQ